MVKIMVSITHHQISSYSYALPQNNGVLLGVILFRKCISLPSFKIAPLIGFSSATMLAHFMLDCKEFIQEKCMTDFLYLSEIIAQWNLSYCTGADARGEINASKSILFFFPDSCKLHSFFRKPASWYKIISCFFQNNQMIGFGK